MNSTPEDRREKKEELKKELAKGRSSSRNRRSCATLLLPPFQNGVAASPRRAPTAARSADVNVDLLRETLTVPETGQRLRCSSCGGKTISTRPAWHTGPAQTRLTITANGRYCPKGQATAIVHEITPTRCSFHTPPASSATIAAQPGKEEM